MRYLWMLLLVPCVTAAAEPEDARLEVTITEWRTNIRGNLQASGTPVDLHSDLALQESWTFFGRLTAKVGRRQRLFLEGSPYRFEGQNTLSRSIVYAGRTYVVNEPISSRAEMTYISGGYQFDFLSRAGGHLGFQMSGAYIDAFGMITATNRGITGSKQQTIGLPLIGMEGRTFLLPHRRWVDIQGEIKGMTFGSYGRHIQGTVTGGVGTGPVSVRVGYQVLDSNLHDQSEASGIRLRLSGPIIGVQFRL